MMKPHIAPTDISTAEMKKALGDDPSRIQIEDYLFDNLNDDFSLFTQDERDEIISWYSAKFGRMM